jgi:hypothetical protein
VRTTTPPSRVLKSGTRPSLRDLRGTVPIRRLSSAPSRIRRGRLRRTGTMRRPVTHRSGPVGTERAAAEPGPAARAAERPRVCRGAPAPRPASASAASCLVLRRCAVSESARESVWTEFAEVRDRNGSARAAGQPLGRKPETAKLSEGDNERWNTRRSRRSNRKPPKSSVARKGRGTVSG